MNPKDISIEYAHIYTKDKIGEEHRLSLEILGELYKVEKEKGHSISLVVLVDDYSFPDITFDYDEFTKWLSERNFKPDCMLRESELIPVCDETLKLIKNNKLREEISTYVQTKKYPCSLFVAAWYLLRLGHISSNILTSEFTAKKLINILPLSFKPFEDKALQIIASTEFAEAVDKIEHRYFEGRLII